MPAGGQGWSDLDVPVTDLLTPFQKPDTHQSWEQRPDGYVYRAERADQITGKPVRFAIQLTVAGQHQAKACGPSRYGVARINADGTDLIGWDLINFLPNFIAPATQMRESQALSGTSRSAAPPPPIGTPVPPITPPPPGRSWAPPQNAQGAASSPTAPSTEPKAADALYSPAYRTCMATGDAANGVTVGILDCAGDETSRQDDRLNQSYRAAMARLPADRAGALRASERAWIKSRDAGCKASEGDEAEGTMGSVIFAQCVLEEEAKRVRVVEAFR